jgi:hypothetical protein
MTYTLPESILQAIVHSLNQQPAGSVRQLLNAIEAECAKQDKERADAAEAEKREAIKAELAK